METTVRKWGNSLAIRIPRSFAAETKMDYGSKVDLSIKNMQLVITLLIQEEDYSLDSFLSKMDGSTIHREIDFGDPQGKELF